MHTHRKGVTAASGGDTMTLRDLLTRIDPSARQESPKTKIERILSEAEFKGEYTIYPVKAESSWAKTVHEVLKVKPEETAGVVGITGYSTSPAFFDKLETTLSAKFNQVHRIGVDEMGWKKIFVCAESEDAVPLLVCANYYTDTRQSVKAQYNSAESQAETAPENNADTNDDDASDIEDIDLGDPFA
jgi:hypothetical protein